MIDMLFGNPTFLQEYRASVYGKSAIHISEDEHMPYIRSNTYSPLIKEIRKLHKAAGNIEIESDDEIVIGVGATQILFATLKAVYDDREQIHIESPYWFRFNTITQMAGYEMNIFADQELLVLPNNPNNKLRIPVCPNTPAVDACYLWPHYFRKHDDYVTATAILKDVNPKVTIFSLAKCTGHAASRIGWAVVKDKEVAKLMRSYIEYSTGGASIEAQVRAASILADLVCGYDPKPLTAALESRWQMLDELNLKNINLLNLKQGGMFLWAESKIPDFYDKLTAKGVLFMKGIDCGGQSGSFRANMGVDLETLDRFINVLVEIDNEA